MTIKPRYRYSWESRDWDRVYYGHEIMEMYQMPEILLSNHDNIAFPEDLARPYISGFARVSARAIQLPKWLYGAYRRACATIAQNPRRY